jgi:hypothetical protein
MVRWCLLAALFAALVQPGYSKSTESRATKHGVGLAGKPRCDCVKQQNDPFVLRFQPCRRGKAALFLRFLKQFHCRDRIVCALKLCSVLAGVVNTSCGLQKAIEAACQSL